jgi:hypothetical protein
MNLYKITYKLNCGNMNRGMSMQGETLEHARHRFMTWCKDCKIDASVLDIEQETNPYELAMDAEFRRGQLSTIGD